jgi:DNA-binding FadR family transcriptional regulator
MGQFKTIKQSRIPEEVLDQLKESILHGKFKSGEKLPSERELIDEFQVSRGVIREAVRALEITGFVVLRQGPAGVLLLWIFPSSMSATPFSIYLWPTRLPYPKWPA